MNHAAMPKCSDLRACMLHHMLTFTSEGKPLHKSINKQPKIQIYYIRTN
jgi:hypothetical protein